MSMQASTLKGHEYYAKFRGVVLPDSLSDLRAQHAGIVVLPSSLAWSGKRDFDLDDPYYVKRFYERVLTETRPVPSSAERVSQR